MISFALPHIPIPLFSTLQSSLSTLSTTLLIILLTHILLLSFFLLVAIGILICVNPDMGDERKAFVTPVLRVVLLPLRAVMVFGRGGKRGKKG